MNARRLKSSVWLLAIGLWPALWLAMPYWIVPDLGHGEGQQFIADTFRGLVRVSLHLDRSVTRHLSHPVLITSTIVMLLAMLAFVLGRKLVHKLDPSRFSLHSLWWGIRKTLCMLLWSCAFATVAILLLSIDSPIFDLWPAVIAMVMSVITLAFVAQRQDIVERGKPPLFWTPLWPGLGPVLITLVAWLISAIISICETLLHGPNWLPGVGVLVFIAAGLIGWLVNIYTSAASLSAWQHGWSLRALTHINTWRSPTTLRTLAAVDLRMFGVVVFLVAPPVVMSAVYFIYVAPQIHAWMQSLHQQQTHPFEAMFIQTGSWITSYGPLCLGWTTGVVIAAGARAIRLIERDAVVTAAEIQ